MRRHHVLTSLSLQVQQFEALLKPIAGPLRLLQSGQAAGAFQQASGGSGEGGRVALANATATYVGEEYAATKALEKGQRATRDRMRAGSTAAGSAGGASSGTAATIAEDDDSSVGSAVRAAAEANASDEVRPLPRASRGSRARVVVTPLVGVCDAAPYARNASSSLSS